MYILNEQDLDLNFPFFLLNIKLQQLTLSTVEAGVRRLGFVAGILNTKS